MQLGEKQPKLMSEDVQAKNYGTQTGTKATSAEDANR